MYIINKNEIFNSELVFQNSKFICFMSYVETQQDIINFLAKYKDKTASCNCYAYVIGKRRENIYKTDNGEIRNSAGRAILNNILNKEFTNIIVLVIKYAGPVLLGFDSLQTIYGTITRKVIDLAPLTKINEYIKVGILFRPLNEIFVKELLSKYNIKITRRDFYRKNLLYTIIVNKNSNWTHELDALIVKGTIYSYKILR
ncbi:YigZ family protein [Spiroplasma sp. DGKH1]|uniref:YigZ family protein n=1 Tax=Spiroplasma sp. DGKH1 TaxID=3050074 RepID=UPI0034C5FDE1